MHVIKDYKVKLLVNKEEKGEERTQQQWEKCSRVEIQQESIFQVNISPYQLIGKKERHGEREKNTRDHKQINL